MGALFRVLMFIAYFAMVDSTSLLYSTDNKNVKFDFTQDGRVWNIVLQNSNDKQRIIEYIPENAVLDKWNEIVTVQYLYGVNIPPKEYYERFMKALRQNVPYNTVRDKILEEDPQSLFWEWKITDDSPLDQQEWIRVFVVGPDTAFLRYTSKDLKSSDKYGPIWQKIIKAAEFNDY